MLERSIEPRDEIETLVVVCETVNLGFVAQRKEDLVGDPGEKVVDEWPVDVVERLKLGEEVLRYVSKVYYVQNDGLTSLTPCPPKRA